jgi:hypothetical protein
MKKNLTSFYASAPRGFALVICLFCSTFVFSEVKAHKIDGISNNNFVLTLNGFLPASANVGSAGFVLTVSGGIFADGDHAVNFNGTYRTTTFISEFELRITLTAADLAMVGNFPVFINGSNGPSNTKNFAVTSCINNTANAAAATLNWSTPSTWSCGTVPIATSNVTIPAGKTITLSSNTTVNNLSLFDGILILNNVNITVSGVLTSSAVEGFSGGGSGGYIVTQGALGSLTQNVTAGVAKKFPIGTSTTRYDPFSLTSNLTQTVKGSVRTEILFGGFVFPELVISSTWDITPASQATISTLKFTPDPATVTGDLANGGGPGIPVLPTNPAAIGHYKRNTGFYYDEYLASQIAGTWTITNYHDGYSPFKVGNAGAFNPVVLAVDLKAISAIKKGAMNIVEWITAEEKNNALFIIERSIDGKHFQSIGNVKGNGTTTDKHNYSFEDRDPSVGLNYYRLQTVESSGATSYSKIVSVIQGLSGKIKVFPTLAQDKLTVIAETNKAEFFEIVNLLNQTVVSGVFEVQKEVSVSHLTNGLYILKIAGESFKFVKN